MAGKAFQYLCSMILAYSPLVSCWAIWIVSQWSACSEMRALPLVLARINIRILKLQVAFRALTYMRRYSILLRIQSLKHQKTYMIANYGCINFARDASVCRTFVTHPSRTLRVRSDPRSWTTSLPACFFVQRALECACRPSPSARTVQNLGQSHRCHLQTLLSSCNRTLKASNKAC